MAFSQLKHGRPGPVLVEIPRDVATEEFPDSAFHYTPVKPYKSSANPDDVRDLVTALLQAACPIINSPPPSVGRYTPIRTAKTPSWRCSPRRRAPCQNTGVVTKGQLCMV